MYKRTVFALILLVVTVSCSTSQVRNEEVHGDMKVTSKAFDHGERIPSKYTCDGDDINPPLKVENIPEGTKTLAVTLEDPDAPGGTFDHWIVWNVRPGDIAEGSVPGDSGENDFGKQGYGGPCPPSGEHRYFFTVYAVDSRITLDESAGKKDLLKIIKDRVLDSAQLMGVYSKT